MISRIDISVKYKEKLKNLIDDILETMPEVPVSATVRSALVQLLTDSGYNASWDTELGGLVSELTVTEK